MGNPISFTMFKTTEKIRISQRVYQANFTTEQRERHNASVARSRKDNRKQWEIELIKRDYTSCVICGYNEHFIAIDYHHPNPDHKTIPIPSSLMVRTPTEERVQALIDETVPLCAICHRLIHSGVKSFR